MSTRLVIGQELKPIVLPAPQTSGGKPLMQALKERKSTREFSPEKLSPRLSNLLWAAWGINREDGRRTAPSASNRQEIDIYVVTADGAYVYDAKGNASNLQPTATSEKSRGRWRLSRRRRGVRGRLIKAVGQRRERQNRHLECEHGFYRPERVPVLPTMGWA
ncbi:MAG TPA: nitroreductase family protein [Bryobacteraceae bacterium]|nr:nitroreductase family protein [Bryobacteraceae bacterium]